MKYKTKLALSHLCLVIGLILLTNTIVSLIIGSESLIAKFIKLFT